MLICLSFHFTEILFISCINLSDLTNNIFSIYIYNKPAVYSDLQISTILTHTYIYIYISVIHLFVIIITRLRKKQNIFLLSLIFYANIFLHYLLTREYRIFHIKRTLKFDTPLLTSGNWRNHLPIAS